jgi:hypothetical protein
MPTTRERLHDMLDILLEERLGDADNVLKPLLDPVALALLNAPDDDEEATAEDLADLNAAHEAYLRRETIPHEEIRREFGG